MSVVREGLRRVVLNLPSWNPVKMADERGTLGENLETGRYLIADNFNDTEEIVKKDVFNFENIDIQCNKKEEDFKLELRL